MNEFWIKREFLFSINNNSYNIKMKIYKKNKV